MSFSTLQGSIAWSSVSLNLFQRSKYHNRISIEVEFDIAMKSTACGLLLKAPMTYPKIVWLRFWNLDNSMGGNHTCVRKLRKTDRCNGISTYEEALSIVDDRQYDFWPFLRRRWPTESQPWVISEEH